MPGSALPLPAFPLRQCLFLNLELGWQPASPNHLPVSDPHSTGITDVYKATPGLSTGTRDPNSASHAFAASAPIPTDLSPSLVLCLLKYMFPCNHVMFFELIFPLPLMLPSLRPNTNDMFESIQFASHIAQHAYSYPGQTEIFVFGFQMCSVMCTQQIGPLNCCAC